MKKFILGLVIGIVVSAGGSVLALSFKIGDPIVSNKTMPKEEQINRGYLFDINTGKKLETKKVLTVEERLKNIEDRLSKLEKK